MPGCRVAAGLPGSGTAAGLSDAQITACLSDRAATDRIVAMTTAAPDSIEGTPGFFINGKQAMGVFSWDKLLPLLRAGGAR